MVIGENEKMPAALIQPNFEFVKEWAQRHDITLGSNAEIASNKKVIERIEELTCVSTGHQKPSI